MNRRKFLKRTSLIATGIVIAPMMATDIPKPFANSVFANTILTDDRFMLVKRGEYSHSYVIFDFRSNTKPVKEMIFHTSTQTVKRVLSEDEHGNCIVWKRKSDYIDALNAGAANFNKLAYET